MTNNESSNIRFNDLSDQEQKLLRRLVDSFMLTAGGLKPLPDQYIKDAVNCMCNVFLTLLTDVILCPKSDLINHAFNESHCSSSKINLTLMIVVSSTLLGQQEVRKILMQALFELDNLKEMGDLFLDCSRSAIRRQIV
ncbi:hypothetical protein [Endozoicomonas sp. 4G]|uniref:hypothetical protein n=1 Tax=Endozoicomonas sp. 4G TaxID=2872754 RepID=UPI002078512E|nr:hypothetical protein [Endozoicomonas sp. 4G]